MTFEGDIDAVDEDAYGYVGFGGPWVAACL